MPRTQTEEALQQSQERYQAFIAQSTEGIWRFELEKPISTQWSVKKQIAHCFKYSYLAECNDAMARMYGFSKASEIIGARLYELMIPTDKKNIEYLKSFVESNYKLTDVESHEVDRDGNIHVFENNLVGIVEKGHVLRAWGTQRDVTQQKQHEKRQEFLEKVSTKLVVSLDHTVTLQEIAQLIVPYLADYCRIAVLNHDNTIKEITVNHSNPKHVTLVQELFEGYKDLPNATYGMPNILRTGKAEIMPFINDEALSNFKNRKVLKLVKQLGLQSYMGVPLIARNKVIGAITFSSIQDHRHYTKKDLQFAEELARRIALTLDNIRLFTEAQEELRKRKQQQINLKFLAEAGKILGSSLDYQITLNQVAKLAVPQIAGWFGIDMLDEKGNLKQIVMRHKDPKKSKWAKEIRKLYPPDMHAKTGIAHVLKTGKSELFPLITDEMLKIVAKDKTHLKILRAVGMKSVMIVPLFSEKKPIGAISFVASETKRYFTKSDLTIAEELAHRASLAIENARLYKNAQEAISIRDDFISVASHELKTPITSVKIFTQVLQKQAALQKDANAGQSLAKMEKQIDKLTELIYNMLNIAKIQSGRMEFNEKEFDFDNMVHDVTDVLQHMTTRHKLIIIGKTGKTFRGDEDRLGQVLSNLISNAIKYSPNAEKVVITLTAKKTHIGVAVQDFGIGMGKQHLNKIFNRFYRVSGATDKTFPGLGIGLYISNEIIKRHGGKLWAESTPKKGSTFYVTLPIIQANHKNVAPTPRLKN